MTPRTAPRAATGSRFWLGKLPIDPVTRPEALAAIARLVASRAGGTVFTPNVDHVVRAESDAAFVRAYSDVSLSLVDGAPVLLASRLLGHAVPERVTGSDLVRPLAACAAERGWRVYLIGGLPGVAEQAARLLTTQYPGLVVAGVDATAIDMRAPVEARSGVVARVCAARPDVVFVALGTPKGELWAREARADLAPAVLVAIGAGLDFLVAARRRAPAWMSAIGLEWSFRLAHEPRRLWRRYLVRAPRFLPIVARSWRQPEAVPREPGSG